MTESGFLTKRRRSPASLGAAFAIQGVLIAGLISMAPKIVPLDATVFTTIRPTITDTPPPPLQQEKPKTERPVARVEAVTTPVAKPDVVFTLPPAPLTPLPAGPVAELGAGVAAVPDVPKPLPVLRDASVDPRFAGMFQPDYPGQLKRAEIEGKAVVRVLIGTDGRVKAVEKVSADDPAFFRATEERARKSWRFKPATRDGVPVESWRTMTVRFQMER